MSGDSASSFFRSIRPWQWVKHSLFAQYLSVWAWKVGSTATTIWVVDAFAGSGEFRDEETGEATEGSPLQAALFAKAYNDHPNKCAAGKCMKLVCIERDPEHAKTLSERLAGFTFATVWQGEFSEHADRVAALVGNDPVLLFLDPIGVKSIDGVTCKRLLHRQGKTDAFVNVQLGVVHRTAGQLLTTGEANPQIATAAANAANIDNFFGTQRWRQIAVSRAPLLEKESSYLHLYFDHVIGTRYTGKRAYPVRSRYRGKRKYYLVHVADHPDADWLINDLLVVVESRLYVLSQQREFPNALVGFAEAEDAARCAKLRADLVADMIGALKATGDDGLSFGDLCLELRRDRFGRLKQGDYDKAAKRLIGQGRVTREKNGLRPKLADTERLRLASTEPTVQADL